METRGLHFWGFWNFCKTDVSQVPAKDIVVGDLLYRVSGPWRDLLPTAVDPRRDAACHAVASADGEHTADWGLSPPAAVQLLPVASVADVLARGAYEPLTTEGTMVVDGVVASCYSHELGSVTFLPLRWAFRLGIYRPTQVSEVVDPTNGVSRWSLGALRLAKAFDLVRLAALFGVFEDNEHPISPAVAAHYFGQPPRENLPVMSSDQLPPYRCLNDLHGVAA
eukprot:TRINITY_DN2726_c0_g1_i1.p1 TRINITY_DN2726_c0_g1~~TRINITY_DN2726_c0_g1_i1.p1  ORF type:complete len:223 (-),score=19.03 TRINITY_DN2726_c0_g1_i1:255-923(-)